MNYDPENAPDAALWLAATDAERQQAVRAAYDLLGEEFDSEEEAQMVCSTQALVETQVAQARPPAVAQTLARLIGEGMTRADALHFMVGAALPHQVLAEGKLEGAEYEADLAQLSQETFQTMMEGEGSEFVPEDALYLFCVGPIATDEGTSWVGIVLDPASQQPPKPIFERTPRKALKKAAAKYGKRELWVSPELSEFAPEFGFQIGIPGDQAVSTQAFMNTVLLNGPTFSPAEAELVEDSLEAILAFVEAALWRWWQPGDRIVAKVTVGDQSERWDAAIRGPEGEEGLVLCPEGTLGTVGTDPGPARMLSFVQQEVAFGEVFEGLWPGNAVPFFHRRERSTFVPYDRGSLAVLCAAIRAAAQLKPDTLTASASHGKVTVELTAPAARDPG